MPETLKIDSLKKLEINIRIFKKALQKQGVDKFQMYPVFCAHLEKNEERYVLLDKWDVLNMACEIFLED